MKKTSIKKENWGVHETHCCVEHGCKYGNEDCPVVIGLIKQKYFCQDCTNNDNYVINNKFNANLYMLNDNDKGIAKENLKKLQPIFCAGLSVIDQLRILTSFAEKLELKDAAEHLKLVVGKNE
jgi:hypothetical protein